MIKTNYDLGDVVLIRDTYYETDYVGTITEIKFKLEPDRKSASVSYSVKIGNDVNEIKEVPEDNEIMIITEKVGSILLNLVPSE